MYYILAFETIVIGIVLTIWLRQRQQKKQERQQVETRWKGLKSTLALTLNHHPNHRVIHVVIEEACIRIQDPNIENWAAPIHIQLTLPFVPFINNPHSENTQLVEVAGFQELHERCTRWEFKDMSLHVWLSLNEHTQELAIQNLQHVLMLIEQISKELSPAQATQNPVSQTTENPSENMHLSDFLRLYLGTHLKGSTQGWQLASLSTLSRRKVIYRVIVSRIDTKGVISGPVPRSRYEASISGFTPEALEGIQIGKEFTGLAMIEHIDPISYRIDLTSMEE
jgi:hypothetical protein